VVKEITSDAIKYLATTKTSCSWEDCLLDVQSLRAYVDRLQQGPEQLTASTIAEKIRRLKLCVEYVAFLNEDNKRIQRCTRVLMHLTKLRTPLRKEIQQRKGELRIRSRAEVGSASNPKSFLNSPKIKEDIRLALDTTNCNTKQHKLILAYIAANIIYFNAQRPGVVQNMTIDEYNDKTEDSKGKYLVNVLHHKTSSSSGPAEIIIEKEVDVVIESYLHNIRQHITPKSERLSDRLFLTHTGNEYVKISENIKEIANAYGYDAPTATLNRKVFATSAREHLTRQEALAIHSHMSHAPETSMRSYQYPDLKDSTETYDKIKWLQSKKYFSEDEDCVILKEWLLTNKTTPSLKLCRQIARKHDLIRTAKQVQDRWKTLNKRH